MKRLPLVLLLSFVAFSQSGSKDEIPICGLGHHECHCLQRTSAIRQAMIDRCQRENLTDKAVEDCIKAHAQSTDHCSLAERWDSSDDLTDEEMQQLYAEAESGKEVHSKMGPLCTMACKPHDCQCDDGPVCHFGHDASAHKKSGKRNP